eukprot:GFKZ01014284.1.p1 GENE.GFKZ01014284.1~~GFKZ01014284.1.p1  ORF type:complete len:557 (-),score=74.85 GFKZ01014284.1:209-1879(-)
MPPPDIRNVHPSSSLSQDTSREKPSSSILDPASTTPLTASPSPPSLSSINPPTLSSLPDEVIRRILNYLVAPSLRGTPYYPPDPPFSLLPLSLVSTTMRHHASRLLSSDFAWNSWIDSFFGQSTAFSEEQDSIEGYTSAWYRFAGVHLRHFTYASKPRIRMNSIVALVASIRPRLTKLDLSSITDVILTKEMEQAVGAILRDGRDSITDLHVRVGSGVSAMVATADMCKVKVLGMRYSCELGKEAILQLMRGLRGLEHVSICILAPMPLITEEEIASVGGLVKVMTVKEWGGRTGQKDLWNGCASWVRGMRDLKELILRDVRIGGGQLRDLVADVEKAELVQCTVKHFELCLNEAVMGKVTRLEMGQVMGFEGVSKIRDLGEGLVAIDLKVDKGGIMVLGGMLEKLSKLKDLTLYVSGNERDKAGEQALVDAVMKVSTGLKKLVVSGHSLPAVGAEHIIRRLAGSLEYMVVGLNAGMGSLSLEMIRLLKGVVTQCKKIKILCFGLFLQHDARARELNSDLLEAIEEAERLCEELDTTWLRRGAKRLLEIPSVIQHS